MNFKILTLTLLFSLTGCNQGKTGLRQKPIPGESENTTVIPHSMERGPGDRSQGQNANQTSPAIDSGAQTNTATNSGTNTTGATTPDQNSATTVAQNSSSTTNVTSTTPANTAAAANVSPAVNSAQTSSSTAKAADPSEAKGSTIGTLEYRNKSAASTEAPSEEKSAEDNSKPKEIPKINETEVAAQARQKFDKEAAEAENKDDSTRTEDEKKLWIQLVNYVADHGTREESVVGFYISIKDETTANLNAPHVGNYLSVVGGPGENGDFSFTRAEANWENWTATEGEKLDGDQYMFLLSRDGNVAKSWHNHFIKDKDDHILVQKSLPLSKEDADKKWSEVRGFWYKKLQSQLTEKK